MDGMCQKCHVRPCDPNLKKPLCRQCAIPEMLARKEEIMKELREREDRAWETESV